MKIGVLAIQGDFAAHARMVERAGAEAIEVRAARDLDGANGLIIPGGESTTMLKLLSEEAMVEPVKQFAKGGRPVLGTCAGAILLAHQVHNPAQMSLGLIDIDVERNAYGRQVDSFIGMSDTTMAGGPVESVFIRAPRIRRVGANVEVLATIRDDPVLVREGNVIVATFHPELTADLRVHSLLINMVKEAGDGITQVGRDS
ncbi:MAG TPA: pyridoxal 5'-phosphate synthase glutaminase subunit PdxT [Blastocatellia bacterium]|nr:pyridoxal 5'-phosphate synthase glutaminase subunit PdxT [Blastocatellia bacterium]